jgi:hypothetical protein
MKRCASTDAETTSLPTNASRPCAPTDRPAPEKSPDARLCVIFVRGIDQRVGCERGSLQEECHRKLPRCDHHPVFRLLTDYGQILPQSVAKPLGYDPYLRALARA